MKSPRCLLVLSLQEKLMKKKAFDCFKKASKKAIFEHLV